MKTERSTLYSKCQELEYIITNYEYDEWNRQFIGPVSEGRVKLFFIVERHVRNVAIQVESIHLPRPIHYLYSERARGNLWALGTRIAWFKEYFNNIIFKGETHQKEVMAILHYHEK